MFPIQSCSCFIDILPVTTPRKSIWQIPGIYLEEKTKIGQQLRAVRILYWCTLYTGSYPGSHFLLDFTLVHTLHWILYWYTLFTGFYPGAHFLLDFILVHTF